MRGIVRWVLAPLFWLERARGRRRLALLGVYALVALMLPLVVYRYVGIWSLPDVGDPFAADPAPSASVARADDAFSLYVQARKAYQSLTSPNVFGGVGYGGQGLLMEILWDRPFADGWAKADPQLRAWVEANRHALALWRKATERPEVVVHTSDDTDSHRSPLFGNEFYSFMVMAQLEAARRQEAGDLAGAWAWHRGCLRAVRQLGDFDPFYSRSTLEGSYHPWLRRSVSRWASDPNVDAALLRKALQDVRAIESLRGKDSDALEREYHHVMSQLDHLPDHAYRNIGVDLTREVFERLRWQDTPISPDTVRAVADLLIVPGRFALHEPLRSRRVANLIFVNWREHIDAFAAGRGDTLQTPGWGPSLILLTDETGADPEPGGLSVDEMDAWFDSTLDLKPLLPALSWYVRGTILRSVNQGTLEVDLASRLYAKEHDGTMPPSPDALVGPYLPTLPERFVDPTTMRPDQTTPGP